MSEQRLFISHASEDAAVVNRIVIYLEANGVPCWISSRDIPPRAIYADAIAEGMQACSACVVIVSAAANASKAVKRELELASHDDKPFIPIRIDGSEPTSGLAYYLRNTQWVEYKRDGESALERMVPHARSATPQAKMHSPPVRQCDLLQPQVIAAIIAALSLGSWAIWSNIGVSRSPSPGASTTRTLLAEGSRWIGYWECCGQPPMDLSVVFQGGGQAVFSDGVRVQWTQNGETISWQEGNFSYSGQLQGNKIRGSITSPDGEIGMFELTRSDA